MKGALEIFTHREFLKPMRDPSYSIENKQF